MTASENIAVLLILGIILCAGLCLICYYLGKVEGKEELKAEIDKQMRSRGNYYERQNRKPRIY